MEVKMGSCAPAEVVSSREAVVEPCGEPVDAGAEGAVVVSSIGTTSREVGRESFDVVASLAVPGGARRDEGMVRVVPVKVSKMGRGVSACRAHLKGPACAAGAIRRRVSAAFSCIL
jgi:hypothetical protein